MLVALRAPIVLETSLIVGFLTCLRFLHFSFSFWTFSGGTWKVSSCESTFIPR